MNRKSSDNYDYDVAISFAGEEREIASKLADILRSEGIKIFYDEFEDVQMWGKDLYDYLADIYENRAIYCVMLISKSYEKKRWTNHERRNAQARAFNENREYILPIRLNDVKIPGIPDTIGYIDLRKTSVQEIADLIVQKVRKYKDQQIKEDFSQTDFKDGLESITIPNIKKHFKHYDKDIFLNESFDFIKKYFQNALLRLENKYEEIKTDFQVVHRFKFLCKVYYQGEIKSQCKIWINSFGSASSINYTEGSYSIDKDNSFMDYITVDDSENELKLKLSGMWIAGRNLSKDKVDKQGASEYLWERFSASLEQF